MNMEEMEAPARVTRKDRSDSAVMRQKRAYTKRAAPIGGGGDSIDEIEARLAGGGLSRRERGKLARRKRDLLLAADNPFMNKRSGILPDLPLEEDPEHQYHWLRTDMPGELGGDRVNLHKKSTGPLQYEFVKVEQLPEHWRPLVEAFAGDDGTISYRDVKLARCSRRVRDQKLAAQEARADKMSDRINAQFRAASAQSGGLIDTRIDTDMEESEVRDVHL